MQKIRGTAVIVLCVIMIFSCVSGAEAVGKNSSKSAKSETGAVTETESETETGTETESETESEIRVGMKTGSDDETEPEAVTELESETETETESETETERETEAESGTETEAESETETEPEAEQDDGGEDETLKALAAVMNSNPEDAEDPNTEKPQVEADYSKEFKYSENIVLSGIFETNSYYFQVPDYWDLTYAYAEIQISLSRLIQDVPASLTFMVNDEPVTSYKMDYANGREQTLYVEIPTELLNEGYNSFSITGYVRIYDDEGCIDDFSGANWIDISEESFIQCGYSLTDDEQQIAAYPYPFISTVDETGSGLYVAVSDSMENGELEAALMLRADLGDETDTEDEISLVRWSDIPEFGVQAKILVSLAENLPEEYQSLAQEDLSDRALVKSLREEDGTPVLLITSENEDCLYEAAAMLMDEDRVTQEKTDQTYVKEGSAALAESASSSSDLIAGRYTLESLTDGGLTFIGPFHQENDIYLPFSGGYVLSDSGKVDLQFRYSENLDFDRSMITVYWGDVPVASKKLTKENAGGDTLSFTMPEDVVGTYAGKITIAFDLELPELFCTPRMDEMPWAYVTEDSAFYLPVGESSEYDFSDRPYPFEISSEFSRLLIAVSDEMTASELDTLGIVIARYGVSLSPYGSVQVVKASEASELDKTDYNIITIGTAADNVLLSELNEELHFQYNEAGDAFLGNEYLVLSDTYASSVGTMQLLTSPYGENAAILAVAALDDATIEYVGDFLRKSENVWSLQEDTALIDEEENVKTYRIGEEKAQEEEPLLRKVFEEQPETAVFALTSVGVMMVLLLAAILILVRNYLRGRK